MSIISTYRIPQPRGYSDGKYLIEDTSASSLDYFNIVEFPDVVGGGRYVIKLKGGPGLRLGSNIDVEMIDAEGQHIFCEVVDYSDRFNNYYISFDIYDITAQGLATAYFVGQAVNTEQARQGLSRQPLNVYNVRWTKSFMVMPYERNIADIIFDEPPKVSVAQVITPARLQTQSTASSYTFQSITGSSTLMTIVTSDFRGYDRDFASSENIADTRLRGIQVNPLGNPITMNSVRTFVREGSTELAGGYTQNIITRFNTRVITSASFFKKEHLGGYFEFYDSESYPRQLEQTLPTYLTISGSVGSQLSDYNATIMEIISDTQAVLSKPLTVVAYDTRDISKNKTITYTYKQASVFTGSITYVPTDTTFVTSSTVSQSYAEFTFGDLNPISGEIYRIKTSIKLGSVTGDYKQLNDQIVSPVEYLTDARYPNPSNYNRHQSEYRMIGYFVTQSYLDDYWFFYKEARGVFDVVTGSVTDNIQIQSTALNALYTQSGLLTTQFYQNYNIDQTYTLSFYLTLDPFCELEIYMGSDPLNGYLIAPSAYPKAFIKSENKERSLVKGDTNPYGSLIGRVTNNKASRKSYGLLMYDFVTDASGLGAPVFRSKAYNQLAGRSGSAYISEISIKPYRLNGFTPNIVQYAVPLPTEFTQAASVSQSIDFKIEYYDYTGKQSEYVTFLDDIVLNLRAEIPSNTCQTDKIDFTFNSGA